MSYRMIGNDCSIAIALGAIANGQTQTFATGTNRKSLAKEIGIDEDVETVDFKGLGDGLKKGRARISSATVKITLYVGDTGPLYRDKIGYAVKVTCGAGGTDTPEDYVGMIKHRSHVMNDQDQTESFDVEVGIEGWTYTGTYA